MIALGEDRRIHLEDIPWYVYLPLSYALVIVIGFIFEQDPAMHMQPAGHNFKPGEPKCQIYKSVSLTQSGSILNLTIGVAARFPVSISQAWRSIRLRLAGPMLKEVLRNTDVSSYGMINESHFHLSFFATIGGPVNAEVYCSDTFLATYPIDLPDPADDLVPSSFGRSWVTNVCAVNGTVEFYTNRTVAPPNIEGWATTFVRSSFNTKEVEENGRLIALHLPEFGDSFVGDVTASALLFSVRNFNSTFIISGNELLSRHLASIHQMFRIQHATTVCVRRFEFEHQLKPVQLFTPDDFAVSRLIMPSPPNETRRAMLVTFHNDSMTIDETIGFHELKYEALTPSSLPFTFVDADPVVLPFQASPSILTFFRSFTRIVVVRPAGVECRSALEDVIPRSGLSWAALNATLVEPVQCDESCECVAQARYRIRLEQLVPYLV
jgi:hypothetical protein